MASRKEPKLTRKQAEFVKLVNSGMPGYKAALAVYDTDDPKTASVIAAENLGKPSILQAVNDELVRQGLTTEKLVKPVVDAIQATKIVTSPTEPDKEVPDHNIRLKGVAIASKWLGVDAADKEGNTYNFTQVINEKGSAYND